MINGKPQYGYILLCFNRQQECFTAIFFFLAVPLNMLCEVIIKLSVGEIFST